MLRNALIFQEALDQFGAITTSDNMDEICDRLEQICAHEELALAVMMLFVMKIKNVNTDDLTGVELANTQPTLRDLILPPGVTL